ncbi:MAG: hypothetical protein V2J02_15920 [Pseudomonadales bacterium]|jgi:hypothetical protein|nr:hypothetical protein [Pseudomonadales bacterium]
MDLPEIAVLYRTRDDRGSFVLERHRGVRDHIRAQGTIDLPTTFEAGRAYLARGMAARTLWDWRQAEFAERSLDRASFSELAGENARRYEVAEGRRVAHLVASPVLFGFLRMAETLFDLRLDEEGASDAERRVGVFTELDRAIAFLQDEG